MAFADYGLTWSNLITLKNNGKIEKTSKKRGSDWKIIESDSKIDYRPFFDK